LKGADGKAADCSDPRGAVATRLTRVLAAVCPAGARLGLAVSGGRDSVGLLAGALEAGLGPRCELLHVHHGTGAFADRACELVRRHAETHGLHCSVARLGSTVPPSETRLRAARLDALDRLAAAAGLDVVVLAQHAADRREGVALHLLRGHRGPRALAGMPCLRPLGSGRRLLRPLLAESPALEPAALADAGRLFEHVDDPSNADSGIPRNAVRAWLAQPANAAWSARLERLSARARRDLRDLRDELVRRLAVELSACGRGARVGRAALVAPASCASLSWLAELLRLVTACLAAPCRPRLTHGALLSLERDLANPRGTRRTLAASPRELALELRRDGLHLPHAALADVDPRARLLGGLARLPWESP